MIRRTTTSPDKSTEALRLVSVRKVYGSADNTITALDGVNLTLAAGTFTAVMGPSGSGKSTFLHCAAGLDQPTQGQIFVDGVEMTVGSETTLTKFRRERIGFVFQQFNLLPTLTVQQNVTLPLRLAGRKVDRSHCHAVLQRVGLGNRLDHRPAALSGGQQQRVAIARALVTNPALILADEPTGALDSRSTHDVLTLLTRAVREFGQTVVMVTHNPLAAAYADSVLFFLDGRIMDHLVQPTADALAARMTHLDDEVAPQLDTAGA